MKYGAALAGMLLLSSANQIKSEKPNAMFKKPAFIAASAVAICEWIKNSPKKEHNNKTDHAAKQTKENDEITIHEVSNRTSAVLELMSGRPFDFFGKQKEVIEPRENKKKTYAQAVTSYLPSNYKEDIPKNSENYDNEIRARYKLDKKTKYWEGPEGNIFIELSNDNHKGPTR